MKAIKLDLPAFAFLDGNNGINDTLEDRTLVLHIRSASVLEFFHDEVLLKENIIYKEFDYINTYHIMEQITIALHYCPTIDIIDKELIIENIINPAIDWYKEYLYNEDQNIIKTETVENN